MKSYCNGGPNCTPFWELSQEDQDAIVTEIAVANAAGSPYTYDNVDGSLEGRCRKCGELHLTHNENDEHWCRRCRYLFYDEYFGYDE